MSGPDKNVSQGSNDGNGWSKEGANYGGSIDSMIQGVVDSERLCGSIPPGQSGVPSGLFGKQDNDARMGK